MTYETSEGVNPTLESLRSLTLAGFRGRYSSDVSELPGFGIHEVFAVSTEAISTAKFEKLPLRGGIHLSVAGGLDTPLTQVSTIQPDLSILCDVNSFAVPMIDTRLKILDQALDGRQYWDLFELELEENPRLSGSKKPIHFHSDRLGGGWSSPEHFTSVKEAWKKGIIKVINADITTGGIQTGMQLASATGLPIRLINLSNIFDNPVNRGKLGGFKSILRMGLADGRIDPGSQVVATSIHDGLRHKIWPTKEFSNPRRITV